MNSKEIKIKKFKKLYTDSTLNQMDIVKEKLQQALVIAHKQNIDAFEIHITCNQGHVINVRNLKPEKIEFNMTQNMCITVYHQKSVGYA